MLGAEDARRLAAVRIGLSALLAVRLATTDFDALSGQPRALFQPRTYMAMLDAMPSSAVATALQMVGVISALAAAAGFAVVVTLPSAIGCALVLDGMLNSAGRVVVGDALLLLCLLAVLGGGPACAEAWRVGGRRRPTAPLAGGRYGWPIRTAMVVVALAYFFAGCQKLRHGGPAWATSDNLRWILYAASDGQAHPNAVGLFVAAHPWTDHLLAAATLLLETGFPVVLFVPRVRWLVLAAAGAMHAGVLWTLHLDYLPQWLTAVIVLGDWPAMAATARRVVGVAAAPAAPVVAGETNG